MINLKTSFNCALGVLFSCQLALAEQTNPSGMSLDLGAVSDLVEVTPEYSNAVLAVVLPRFSDAAKKLNLPVPQPITRADIAGIHFLPFLSKTFRNPSVSILLKNDWAFEYSFGYVHSVSNGHGYSGLQDPDLIPF